jgi:hypothetical protein
MIVHHRNVDCETIRPSQPGKVRPIRLLSAEVRLQLRQIPGKLQAKKLLTTLFPYDNIAPKCLAKR